MNNFTSLQTTQANTLTLQVPLISLQTYELWVEILHVPTLALSILGIITNIVNIRVFLRQGVTSDSPTMSLFALSVSDFLVCSLIFPQAVCFYFDAHSDIQNVLIKNCFVLSTMASTYPHIVCTKITCWLTVYISVERAVSVVLPLKVKSMFKVQNTVKIIVLICLVLVVAHIPYATTTSVIWLSDPNRNNSYRAVNSHSALGSLFFQLNNIIINLSLTSVAMVVVAMATFTMVTRLIRSRKWRALVSSAKYTQRTSQNDNASDALSLKETEVVKTMVAITTIFLACQAVSHIPAIVMSTVPGVAVDGYNRYVFNLIYSVRFVFEVLNSAVHFFVYFKLSSKYNKTLTELRTNTS
ncbi:pyrokinin-1 receptor-like [Biomphalaria glabrata]|uniref:Pyrokinin-1 receptor-like n=1 Tax=Biomphalaria glabrata TaxID=6526 RepID=A0A9U8E6K5_BIOGL|nr:pyrokinin-1 receptor-like [Biomphalaria glabrata]